MNNRSFEIDNFLKYMAEIKNNNPNFDLTRKVIYGELTRIGIKDEDRNLSNENYFNYWIKKYENAKNISVFVNENWPYFCQFINGNTSKLRSHIKMYVGVNSNSIREVADVLFNFMKDNNIIHTSKIGKMIRNDDIVLRVTNKKDAAKIANFIAHNKYIQDNLMKPNPFMLNDGNIGYATDANLSYSNQISKYIHGYLNSIDTTNLENINTQSLLNYITKQYQEVFINGNPNDIKKFEIEHELNNLEYRKKIENIANIVEVTKLIMCSLGPNNNLNNVFQVYDEFMNEKHMSMLENTINDKYEQAKNNSSHHKIEVIDMTSIEIIKKALIETNNAYGYNQAVGALKKIVSDGDFSSITRRNGARDSIKSISEDKIKTIVETISGNNYDLFMSYTLRSDAAKEKIQCLENACLETLNKYGMNQANQAITNSMTKGNFMNFTNNMNCRTNLIKTVDKQEIYELMKQTLMNSGIALKPNVQEQFLELMQLKLEQQKYNSQNDIVR